MLLPSTLLLQVQVHPHVTEEPAMWAAGPSHAGTHDMIPFPAKSIASLVRR